MTFLAPIAGLIGALIGAPLLIALYLLKLRRKPVKVSSTLLWEQAVQDLQANVPLRWLRWSWLLLLQLVILACLLAALARPAVPGVAPVAARTVIVIDCSASMSARDGAASPDASPRSRLDESRQSALDLVEQIRRASGSAGSRHAEAMVIAMSASARIVQSFTSDPRTLREAIESIQPTDQPANLDEVVRLASAAALAGSDGNSPATRTSLILFSDGSLDPATERLPNSVDLHLVRSGPSPIPALPAASLPTPDNLGIVAIGARRDADTPTLARLFARVSNSGPAPVDATLSCTVNGEPAGLIPLTIPAATRTDAGAFTPGEASGTLELDRPLGGLVLLSLARPDLLAADNIAGLVLRPVSKPHILVAGPNDPSDTLAPARGRFGIDRFLLGALQDLEPAEVRPIDAAALRDLTSSGSLAPYDLLILDRVPPPPATAPIPTIIIGAPVALPGLRIEPAIPGTPPTRFISWKRAHSILKNAPLDAVLIAPPMRMTIDVAPPAGAPTITTLALGTGGPLIALTQDPGPRATKRLYLAFDLLRTNWGKDVSFPVFFSSAVDVLTGRGDSAAGIASTTSEPVSITAAPGTPVVHVAGAETFDITVPAPGPDGALVSLGVPRLAGVYRCAGVAPEDKTIVANLANPRESALATQDTISIAGRTSTLSAHSADDQSRREIWHWFVLAAMTLLTIEWFLYAWRSRPA